MAPRRRQNRARTVPNPAEDPPLGPEESASTLDEESERLDDLREAAGRCGPRGPGSGGKGRSRLEREQHTNRAVPAGHERKIATKIRASLAKRRRKEQKTAGARAKRPVKAKAAKKLTVDNLGL
uniref:Uncharacterized protein n=2 Tax=Sphaerodactylus townsendi TaxID=933632 RepID=A0ACB8EDF7_9SAUR